MKRKRLIWSLYDINVGSYDEFNPRYVYKKSMVPEISYIIATNPPLSLSEENIRNMLQIDFKVCNEALEAMKKINAISERGGKYKINFPVFLEEDLISLSTFCGSVGEMISKRIISLKKDIDSTLRGLTHFKAFEIERLRYHVIGCETLDGGAMDYFTQEGIIATSKKQPGDRDYIIIANEESEKLREYSNKLLCSCNIFYADNIGIGSFGDGDGSRKDMMRFFRRLQSGIGEITEHKDLNFSYIKLLDDYNKEIAKNSASLIRGSLRDGISYLALDDAHRRLADFIKELGYVDYNENYIIRSCVPVFEKEDKKVIDEVSDLIAKSIYDIVSDSIKTLDKSLTDLTSVKHGVDFKDIANELWHLMFGAANEALVEEGYFARPDYKEGEGRYFQFVTIT